MSRRPKHGERPRAGDWYCECFEGSVHREYDSVCASCGCVQPPPSEGARERELTHALVTALIPIDALMMETGTHKYLAPEVREAMVEAYQLANAVLARAVPSERDAGPSWQSDALRAWEAENKRLRALVRDAGVPVVEPPEGETRCADCQDANMTCDGACLTTRTPSIAPRGYYDTPAPAPSRDDTVTIPAKVALDASLLIEDCIAQHGGDDGMGDRTFAALREAIDKVRSPDATPEGGR